MPIEFSRRAEAFGIPRRNFAKHAAAEFFAKNFHHQVDMPGHDAHAFGKGWFGNDGGAILAGAYERSLIIVPRRRGWSLLTSAATGLEILQRPPENPGIVECAAADAHASAASFIEHFFGGLRC